MIQAYNYMLGSISVKRETKYSVSRRNELKRVYNNIVNLSKSMPLYKINLSKENQEYTIGIKEAAIALKTKLRDMEEPSVSGFKSKTAIVSNNRILSASLLKEDTSGLPEDIRIQVKTLARGQVNKGKELLSMSKSLPTGDYEFKAKVGDETYYLKFTQDSRTDNQITLQRMADLLNESVPGINTKVEKGSAKDYYSLMIESDLSGRFGDKKFIFEDSDIFQEGIVDFLGMNRMVIAPSYAEFELNGVNKKTATNTFTIDNTLCVTLHESSSEPAVIKVVPDSGLILDAVESTLVAVNKLIKLAKDRTTDSNEHYQAKKLISEMKSLEVVYKEELSACGITSSEDGTFHLEDSLAVQAAQDGGMESLFTKEDGFIARLLYKAETIAINPMEYLDKTVVTYPDNEKKIYRNPYMTSMYSGLFFNSYC